MINPKINRVHATNVTYQLKQLVTCVKIFGVMNALHMNT
jgi:hypothetical protein